MRNWPIIQDVYFDGKGPFGWGNIVESFELEYLRALRAEDPSGEPISGIRMIAYPGFRGIMVSYQKFYGNQDDGRFTISPGYRLRVAVSDCILVDPETNFRGLIWDWETENPGRLQEVVVSWGDGTSDTLSTTIGAAPVHIYAGPGDYTVTTEVRINDDPAFLRENAPLQDIRVAKIP